MPGSPRIQYKSSTWRLLQGIPDELFQAAQVDGANKLQVFRHITLPLLRPITLYVTVLCAANSFQMFDEAYMMDPRGGRRFNRHTGLPDLYTAFESFKFGQAATISMVNLVVYSAFCSLSNSRL